MKEGGRDEVVGLLQYLVQRSVVFVYYFVSVVVYHYSTYYNAVREGAGG